MAICHQPLDDEAKSSENGIHVTADGVGVGVDVCAGVCVGIGVTVDVGIGAEVTVMLTVARLESASPSFTLKIKLSAPLNPAFGVYVRLGGAPLSVPCTGLLTML